MVALAGGAHGVAYPAQTFYSHLGSPLLHDVATGGDGQCNGEYASCGGSMSPLSPLFPLDCGPGAWICNANAGYDGPTGVGSPSGIGVFKPDEAPAKGGEEVAKESEPKTEPGEEKGKSEGGSPEGGLEGSSSKVGEGGGGGSGGASPGGGEAGSPPTAGGSSASSPSATAGQVSAPRSPTGTATGQAVGISALALTANARSALRHGRIAVAQVAFSFTLSRAVTVRATLAVRTGPNGHMRWRALPASLTFAAIGGVNRRRLHGSGRLTRGVYSLTLRVADGPNRVYSREIRFFL
jgi:hypothetical protein